MIITVLLFGHYRDAVKDSTFPLTVKEGATVADAAAQLADTNPRLSDLLQRTRFAVGAEFARADTVLRDGDELAFLPPDERRIIFMDADVPEERRCPRCGSRHLMRDVGVTTDSGKVKAVAFPGSLTKRAYGITPLLASVCGDCGHAELYVAEHTQMWEAWRRHNA